MAVVEGYTFAVDMQDRGVVATLRQMRSAASAMKSEMRAGFETIQRGEGTLSAYDFKLQESQRLIDNYKNMQRQLREELRTLDQARENELQKNGTVTDQTEKRYSRVARQIENYQHQINSLRRGQHEARAAMAQFNTGLEQSRRVTQSVKQVMTEYVNELKSEGRAFKASKAEASSYKYQHQALVQQYKAEISETTRLSGNLSRLNSRYLTTKNHLQQLKNANKQNTSEYQRAAGRMNVLRENMQQTNTEMAKQVASALKVRTSINQISRAEASVNAGGITRLSRAMNNLSANARRASSNTRAWASSVRGSMMTAAFAVAPLGVAIGGAVKQSVSLQNEWVKVRNYLYTGADSAKEASHEVSRLSKIQSDARNYSDKYGYSQKQIAEQYGELVKRGYTANASIGSMKSMLEAARASGDDYADVVKNVSGAVDAFGLRSSNTAKMLENTNRVTNAMAFSADKTATDFEGMGNAMSYVAGTAHGAGFSIEQTAAAIGVLSNANIEGTRAGTGLRKVINSLLKPTAGAEEALRKYGMTMDDFKTKSGALKSLPQIMSIINQHTKELGKADRGAFFKAVFGATGQESAMMLAQNSKELEKLTRQEKEAEKHDYVGNLAKKQMQSTQMQLASLKQRIINLGVVMGNALLPQINKVGQAFSEWLGSKSGRATIKEVQEAIKALSNTVGNSSGTILAFFGGFVKGLAATVKWGAKAIGAIQGIVNWIGKLFHLNGAGNNLAKWAGEAAGAITGLIGAFKLFKTVVSGMSAVREDIRNLFRLDGVTSEQTKIDAENQKLKENIALWKEHNTVSGGDSAVGSSITSDKPNMAEKEGTTAKNISKGAEGAIAISGAEEVAGKAGERSGARFLSGFMVRAKGLTRAILGLFLPEPFLNAGAKVGGYLMIGIKRDLSKVASLGSFVGSKIVSAFGKIVNSAKGLAARISSSAFGQRAAQVGRIFASKFSQAASVVKRFVLKWFVPESWRKIGASTADAFSNGFSKIRNLRFNPKNIFRGTEKVAAESGTKTGESFIARLGAKFASSRVAALGTGLAKRIGGPFMIAFSAIDIMRAWNTSSHKERAKNVGGVMGSLAGMTAGAKAGGAIGTALGSVVPGIGNAAGGLLGTIIGTVAGGAFGTKFGKVVGPAFAKFAHGTVKTFDLVFMKHDWSAAFSNLGKSWKQFWNGMGNWWDKVIGKRTTKVKASARRETAPVRSMGSTHYSKADIANVRAMTSAVNSYKKAVRGLKSTVKSNDPSKEIQRMNKALKAASKNWKSFAKTTDKSDKSIKKTAKSLKEFSKSVTTLSKSTKTLNGKNGLKPMVKELTQLSKTLKKDKLDKLFKNLANSIKKSKLSKELSSMDKTVKRSARNWRNLVKPLRSVSNSFKQLQKSMRLLTNKKNGFTSLNNSVRNLYRTLRKNPFGKFIANQAKIANNAMSGKKSGFVTTFNRQTRSMTRELRRFGNTFRRDWRNTWRNVDHPVSSGMGSARSALSHHLGSMENRAESFESTFLKGWKSWINQVLSTFRSGFNKLPGYASSAMRDIINRLNRGIQGVNNVIDNFGGDKHLSLISYAQGTRGGGHPGGHMMVNDSNRPHWKELVKLPNRPWTIFKERNVLIPNAPAGTQVINGEKTHEIMNAMGVRYYAGGTMTDAEQDEMAEEFMDNPKAASKKLLLRMTNWNSKVPVVADLGKAMTIAFSQGIANVLKDLLGIIKEPINGDWTPVIKSAFRVLHLHAAGWQIAKLLRQIQTESGGNETIVNHWDSNARAGHPSQGLLQFIPSTFYAWADPRYRNINKGFDQLVAAIRCLNAGGEGGWGNVGNGHGWATGGIVSAHGLYEMAEGNLPESIIPLDLNKRPRALEIMDHTLDKMESDGGGTGNIRRGDSKEDLQFKRQVIGLLGNIAGLSKRQVDAILSIDMDKNSMNRRDNRMKFYNKYGRDQHIADYQRLV